MTLAKRNKRPRKRMRPPDRQVPRENIEVLRDQRIVRMEARKDRHLAAWLSYMGTGDLHYARSVKKTLLTRWEREELEKVNARRYGAWRERKASVEKRGGVFLETYEDLTYLPDSAYEARRLMHYVEQ